MSTAAIGVAARRAVGLLPHAPGVYRFRDERGTVLYLGRTVDLRRRVGSYWGGLSRRRHLRRMVSRIGRIEAVVCDSPHEAAWLERNLLEQHRPRWNRITGGLEVPVYIRLDVRARTAGLGVAHEHEQIEDGCFGPYLGGLKVRLAVSALNRMLPLAYTADDTGGSARDLARMLAVDPGDRAALIDTITAVLRGEGEA